MIPPTYNRRWIEINLYLWTTDVLPLKSVELKRVELDPRYWRLVINGVGVGAFEYTDMTSLFRRANDFLAGYIAGMQK